MVALPPNVFDLAQLREKNHVFRDRHDAGEVLSRMLQPYRDSGALMMAVPAGGLPVAGAIRQHLDLELDVLVVSKITLPWNTEAGYGAVAFDGTVRLNHELVARIGLSRSQIAEGTRKTLRKVRERTRLLRGTRPFPALEKRCVILVDDGLASGFTLQAGIESIRKAGADLIAVAVPTGHRESVAQTAAAVNALFCPNIRSGLSFAVADAYASWSDVSEDEMIEMAQKLLAGKRQAC